MSSLIRDNTLFRLNPERLERIIEQISKKLNGRVLKAYVFGSAATAEISEDSDIDLILVVANSNRPFVQRGFDYLDLFEIYPKIDLLVYTENELAAQLADSQIGFWKSVRESMRELPLNRSIA